MLRSCEGFCQTCKYCCYIIASVPLSPSVSLSRGTGTTYITHSHFPLLSGFSLNRVVPSTLPVSPALAMSQQRWPVPWGLLPAMLCWVQALACIFGWQERLGLFLLWQVWCIFLDLIRDGSDSTWSPCLVQPGHHVHTSPGECCASWGQHWNAWVWWVCPSSYGTNLMVKPSSCGQYPYSKNKSCPMLKAWEITCWLLFPWSKTTHHPFLPDLFCC